MDPMTAIAGLNALGGLGGGGGMKLSQTSNNTSTTAISFSNSSNIGQGSLNSTPNNAVSTPINTNANSSGGADTGGGMPSYDYGTGAEEVAATAPELPSMGGTMIWVLVALGAVAVWIFTGKKGL